MTSTVNFNAIFFVFKVENPYPFKATSYMLAKLAKFEVV